MTLIIVVQAAAAALLVGVSALVLYAVISADLASSPVPRAAPGEQPAEAPPLRQAA